MEAYIIGTGVEVPERIVSNNQIADLVEIDAVKIFQSTGIRNRHWADLSTSTSQLASVALRRSIESAGLVKGDVDYLIFGTMTPDRFIPGTATAIQRQCDLRQIPALDIRNACCNILYGLQIAKALIQNETAETIALSFAEIQSRMLDLTPAGGPTSILFGDGASAIIVSNEPRPNALNVVDIIIESDGSYVDSLGVRAPGTEFVSDDKSIDASDYFPKMRGLIVISQSVKNMSDVCERLLARNGLAVKDISWIVPHQANARLIAELANKLNARQNQVVSILENFGNTSSSSVGFALDTLLKENRVSRDEYILIPAFAAGFTWGAALCKVH